MGENSVSARNYRRGFNAAIDAVLNLINTIDASVYDNRNGYNHEVFKAVSLLQPDDDVEDI